MHDPFCLNEDSGLEYTLFTGTVNEEPCLANVPATSSTTAGATGSEGPGPELSHQTAADPNIPRTILDLGQHPLDFTLQLETPAGSEDVSRFGQLRSTATSSNDPAPGATSASHGSGRCDWTLSGDHRSLASNSKLAQLEGVPLDWTVQLESVSPRSMCTGNIDDKSTSCHQPAGSSSDGGSKAELDALREQNQRLLKELEGERNQVAELKKLYGERKASWSEELSKISRELGIKQQVEEELLHTRLENKRLRSELDSATDREATAKAQAASFQKELLQARAAKKCNTAEIENKCEDLEIISTVVGGQLLEVEQELMQHVQKTSEIIDRFLHFAVKPLTALRRSCIKIASAGDAGNKMWWCNAPAIELHSLDLGQKFMNIINVLGFAADVLEAREQRQSPQENVAQPRLQQQPPQQQYLQRQQQQQRRQPLQQQLQQQDEEVERQKQQWKQHWQQVQEQQRLQELQQRQAQTQSQSQKNLQEGEDEEDEERHHNSDRFLRNMADVPETAKESESDSWLPLFGVVS